MKKMEPGGKAEVVLEDGLPVQINGYPVAAALFCSQAAVSCNDRVSVGYKYKVRIKLSGEGIKTIQVVQTEDGEWYFVSK